MRILKSRRGKDGYNYHTCPVSGKNISTMPCHDCKGLDTIEQLDATYRVHCLFDAADELPQIKPAKAASKVPPKLGGDPYKLASHQLLEPKLDGVRIFMHLLEGSNRLTTRRKNKEGLYNEVTDQLPHLRDLLVPEFYWGSVLDGELQMPTKGSSSGLLGSTMSVIGASPEKAEAYQERWGYAQYQVFDMPFAAQRDDIRKEVLAARRMHLDDFWHREEMLVAQQKHIQPVYAAYCTEEGEKRFYVSQCLAQGYEGAIIKDLEAHYGQLRGWIKIKQKETLDLQIVGWEPGKAGGKHEDGLGSLVMAAGTHGGFVLKEVTVVSPGTDSQRESFEFLMDLEPLEILAECLIAEVEFQCWTKEYRLRHPRVLRYRTDRSEPSVVDFSTVVRS